MPIRSMDLESLRQGYLRQEFTPRQVVSELRQRLEKENAPQSGVWLHLLGEQALEAYLDRLETSAPDALPLYGIPFAIKDNIDLAGSPTTAACPAYAYTPRYSAPAVDRLIQAGAIPLGKTNLDQFATGLVGLRCPDPFPRNPFHGDYIPGGSSSGSAVALARGWVSFSLGTDTAGSGRIPAAFNNVLGLKPTRGLISTRGVVPACRTLDCVSIFALGAADAWDIFHVMAAHDPEDPFSREPQERDILPFPAGIGPGTMRFAVPAPGQLEFFGNKEAAKAFSHASDRLQSLGGTPVEIDFEPFLECARLLYAGPWLAERYAAVRSLIESQPQSLHPVTRRIIGEGIRPTAVDAFEARYRLAALKRVCSKIWSRADVLLTPTAGTIYTVSEVRADPLELNARLGYYTNFMNLLDLAAVAVPAGFLSEGLPFGVTLAGRAGAESMLLEWAGRFHRDQNLFLGRTMARSGALKEPNPLKSGRERDSEATPVLLAVCGAHMRGMPLNHQLQGLGARFRRVTRTASSYRLYALAGTHPPKPGLVWDESGSAMEMEVWELSRENFGALVAAVPRPMCIGKILTSDGGEVPGFLCEPGALEGARDITAFGGWRAFVSAQKNTSGASN